MLCDEEFILHAKYADQKYGKRIFGAVQLEFNEEDDMCWISNRSRGT